MTEACQIAGEVAARDPDTMRLTPGGDVGDQVGLAEGDALLRRGRRERHALVEEGARLDLAREAVNDAEIVRSAAIFAADGSVIGAIEKRGEAPPAPRAPLPADGGRERRPHWVWSRAPSGEPTLEFLEPVVVDGAVTAWVLGEMRPEVLTKRVVELSRSRFGREDRLVVIDRELRVVAGDSARWPAGRSLADQPLVVASRLDAAAFDAVGHGKTTTYVGTDGAATVGTVRVMSKVAWAVAVERPEAEAFGALTTARRELIEEVRITVLHEIAHVFGIDDDELHDLGYA